MKTFLLGTLVGGVVGSSFVCYKLLQNGIIRAAFSDAALEAFTTALYGDGRGPRRVLRTRYDEPQPAYGRPSRKHRA